MRNILVTALATVATTLTLCSSSIAQPAASTAKLIGLTSHNVLVSFDSNRSTNARQIKVKGIDGKLIGIDFRPSNRMLYGITNTSKIYTIDPETGMATMVSTMQTPFMGGAAAGVDFNPVADRLRLVGSNGQNFRVNVDTGATNVDKPLNYAKDDPNMGKTPRISTGAYTNSLPGSKATQLFNIDSKLDALVLQSPPNDGTLKTVGILTNNFGTLAGLDIMTDTQGINTAFAVTGSQLFSVDLSNGMTKMMGMVKVNRRSVSLIDIAVSPMMNGNATAR
jgi:hypothetical protein